MRRVSTRVVPTVVTLRPLTVVGFPALSPTMERGTLTKWKVQVGQRLKPGDEVCDVQTDKTTMAFENSRYRGIVARLLISEGSSSNVKQPMLLLVDKKEEVDSAEVKNWIPPQGTTGGDKPAGSSEAGSPQTTTTAKASPTAPHDGAPFATPLARVEAAKDGISLRGLGAGATTSDPITLSHIQAAAAATPTSPTPAVASPAYDDIPVTPMRATIAQRLQASKNGAPHYYVGCTAVVDDALAVIAQLNAKGNGTFKIGINDFIMKAVARACVVVPEMNASWHGTFIRRYRAVDVAMAVATPEGLFTPILRGVEAKGLSAVATEARGLAVRAREGRLDPAEYTGGTVTVSNLGGMGVEWFTAILNPPHTAIVAVGAMERRAAVAMDESSKEWHTTGKVETVIRLTTSVDHRVADGAVAAKFTRQLKDAVENPLSLLL